MKSFSYTDEQDRCYGAAGMAIGLVVYDGEELLASVSLESEPHETVQLTQDFFFAGNPGVSAKSAWNQLVKNYNIGTSMIIANLLCRYLVNRRSYMPEALRKELFDLVAEEGAEVCALESDEVQRLFDKNFNYLSRVFSHRGVQTVAHDFASALASRRTLSRLDALDLLASLQML